jgi:hypothetical protein
MNVLPQLKEFIGEKVLLSSGDTSKKFNIQYLKEEPKKFNPTEYAKNYRVYLDISYSSILLRLTLCFKNDEHSCFYEEETVYIGQMNSDGSIKNIENEDYYKNLVQTYTVEEQKKIKVRIEELENELTELKYKLI